MRSVYSGCRDKNPVETPEAKEKCASISWGAVKNAGWNKDDKGKWVKETKNIEELATEPGDVVSFHNVTLQRLDVYQTNNGSKVLYPEEHFNNVTDWQNVPVIYQRTRGGKPGKHPEFNDVINNTLNPDEYAVVGHINVANLAESGEPSLKAEVAFNNHKCTLAAQERELSLSTGFSAPIANMDDGSGKKTIAGQVIPNHVLIFRRGSCPNCYSNDNGAKFENMETGDPMTEEKKKVADKVFDAFKNLATSLKELTNKDYPWDQCMADQMEKYGDEETARKVCGKIKAENNITEESKMEEKKMSDELTNMASERDALKNKVAELTNLNEQYKKANDEAKVAFENIAKENADLKWVMVKNILPAGWVDTPEKEAATRAEYTDKPHDFAQKLAKHVNQIPADKPSEGQVVVNQVPEESKDWGTIGVPARK